MKIAINNSYLFLAILILTCIAFKNTHAFTVLNKETAVQKIDTKNVSSGKIEMSVSVQSLNFNSANIGTTQTMQVVLSNASTSEENLLIYPFPLNSPFSFSPSGIRAIAPGSSQSFDVTFSPTTGGQLSAIWTIINNSTNLPQSFQLAVSGTGAGSGTTSTGNSSILMTVTPPEKDFGDVWTAEGASFTFVISNSKESTGPLIISQDAASLNPFKTDLFGTYTIAPGQSKNVVVSFKPTNVQIYSKTWIINNNSTNRDQRLAVTLRGKGTI